MVAGLIALHGLSDEVHQFFVPERSCSVLDVIVDFLGGLLFLSIPWPKEATGRPKTFRLAISVGLLAVLLAWLGSEGRPFPDELLEQALAAWTR